MRDDWDRERESLVSELNEKLMKLALPMKTIESVRVERGPSQPVAAQMFHARRERQRSRLDRRRGGVSQAPTSKVHFGVRPYKPNLITIISLSLILVFFRDPLSSPSTKDKRLTKYGLNDLIYWRFFPFEFSFSIFAGFLFSFPVITPNTLHIFSPITSHNNI